MTVKELIIKANEDVPFPWTMAKIKKAGHDPTSFLLQFGQDLERCGDVTSDPSVKLMKLLHELKMFG